MFREGDQPGRPPPRQDGFPPRRPQVRWRTSACSHTSARATCSGLSRCCSTSCSRRPSARTPAPRSCDPGRRRAACSNASPDLRRTLIAESTKAEEVILQMSVRRRDRDPKDRATSMMMSLGGPRRPGPDAGARGPGDRQLVCTDCHNCIDACGRRHGHCRLNAPGYRWATSFSRPPAGTARTRCACSAASTASCACPTARSDRRGQLHRLRRVRRALPVRQHPDARSWTQGARVLVEAVPPRASEALRRGPAEAASPSSATCAPATTTTPASRLSGRRRDARRPRRGLRSYRPADRVGDEEGQGVSDTEPKGPRAAPAPSRIGPRSCSSARGPGS